MDNLKLLRSALEYLGGARFANYSGQVVEQDKDGRDRVILFDLGCTCGEIASKNANEYAEHLVALLNGAREALAENERLRSALDAVLEEE
jgi:hypothetical protein